jgi:GNAT superfamily N-acetyltransferase
MEDADSHPLAVLILDGGWIDQLYVEPTCTGMGLGSHLIELAKWRRPAGLQLWTFVTNTGAQRFYRRHGFAVAETTDGSRNEEKAPDIRFIWMAPSWPQRPSSAERALEDWRRRRGTTSSSTPTTR